MLVGAEVAQKFRTSHNSRNNSFVLNKEKTMVDAREVSEALKLKTLTAKSLRGPNGLVFGVFSPKNSPSIGRQSQITYKASTRQIKKLEANIESLYMDLFPCDSSRLVERADSQAGNCS